jgi:hypothetical protein
MLNARLVCSRPPCQLTQLTQSPLVPARHFAHWWSIFALVDDSTCHPCYSYCNSARKKRIYECIARKIKFNTRLAQYILSGQASIFAAHRLLHDAWARCQTQVAIHRQAANTMHVYACAALRRPHGTPRQTLGCKSSVAEGHCYFVMQHTRQRRLRGGGGFRVLKKVEGFFWNARRTLSK